MRTSLMLSFLLLILLTMVSPSRAVEPESGDLWVTFDASGTTTCATPPPFTTDNVFFVATYGVDIQGYEFSITISDPNIIIFAANDVTNPLVSINVGTPPLEWIAGIGLCRGDPGVLQLVQFTYGFFVPTLSDVLICLGPSEPASLPGVPAYLDCTGTIVPFGSLVSGDGCYPDACGILYPSSCGIPKDGHGRKFVCEDVVAMATSSWGAMKASY